MEYTLDFVIAALKGAGLLDQAGDDEIRQRQKVQETAIRRAQVGARGMAKGVSYDVSPAELVASMGLMAPDGTILDEDRVQEAVAQAIGRTYLKIDPLKLDAPLITATLSRPYATKNVVIPIAREGDVVVVAVDNPFKVELFESLRALTRAELDVRVAAKRDILKCIAEVYGFRSSVKAAAQDLGGASDLGSLERLVMLKSDAEIEATDQHVINAVDFLLRYALDQRASDIHIEPKREVAQVRMRIDGVLHVTHRIPVGVHPAMVSRIKSMARLDIAEKRKPQDGRIKMRYGGREVELRISSMLVAFGEKLVIRLLDPEMMLKDLVSLGFYERELELFQEFIAKPYGIILVTGPTGSGKTTTLYSALHVIATEEVNVITIEDPIEMVFEQLNQTAVHPKIGLTFAAMLRTILRQDPDVIMLGEIRDLETAENAIQAALTGHLVLSTLHTKDSPTAITRLLDLGVQPFLISSTVIGVLAQRLVRKICRHCGEEMTLTDDQARLLGLEGTDPRETITVMGGMGCNHCRQTGYRGRDGVYEILPMSDRIRKLVNQRADAMEILGVARQEGLTTLREGAIRKLAEGVTSFEEVLRVTSDK